MFKKLAITSMMAAGLAFAAPQAEAALISGSLSFTGEAQPLGGTNWATATGIDFGTNIEVESIPQPTGAYAGTEGTTVVFNDFSFAALPVNPLWTFACGANTCSFNFTSIDSNVGSGNDLNSTRTITGTGTLLISGGLFDPTAGTFNLTANGVLGTFSFSSSAGALNAPVPEPGSMLLLGTGLLGLAAAARRRRRKA